MASFFPWIIHCSLNFSNVGLSACLTIPRAVNYLTGCIVCLVLCLTSQSTTMIMSRRSVHLTTNFSLASLTKRLTITFCAHTFACNWQQPFLNQQKGGEWPKKLFHDQSPQKYGTGPESNLRPLDMKSDMLQTVLHGLVQVVLSSC